MRSQLCRHPEHAVVPGSGRCVWQPAGPARDIDTWPPSHGLGSSAPYRFLKSQLTQGTFLCIHGHSRHALSCKRHTCVVTCARTHTGGRAGSACVVASLVTAPHCMLSVGSDGRRSLCRATLPSRTTGVQATGTTAPCPRPRDHHSAISGLGGHHPASSPQGPLPAIPGPNWSPVPSRATHQVGPKPTSAAILGSPACAQLTSSPTELSFLSLP